MQRTGTKDAASVAPMFDLTGMVAVVTGGGRGIGRGCAYALARQGADVVVAYWGHPAAADETVATIRGLGRRAEAVLGNVASAEDAATIIKRAKGDFDRLDVLVNNAGIVTSAPFTRMTEAEWDQVIDVDLKGSFLVAQAAAREMIAEGHGGRIINISSIGSGGVGVGFPGVAHYSAAKGGVIALTETMALELAPHGILVNTVAPGVIETDMTRAVLSDPAGREGTISRIPLRRAGKPEEVAAMVTFLASRESSYCTGATFYVDGGWLAG